MLVNLTVSQRYGVEPWWWYLRDLALRQNILLLPAALAVRRLPKMALIVAATIALFSVIPHKEERFLYPVWPSILIMSSVGLYSLLQSQRLHDALRLRTAWAPAAATCIVAVVSFASALRFHFWPGTADAIRLFDLLARDPPVCGVQPRMCRGSTRGAIHTCTAIFRSVSRTRWPTLPPAAITCCSPPEATSARSISPMSGWHAPAASGELR